MNQKRKKSQIIAFLILPMISFVVQFQYKLQLNIQFLCSRIPCRSSPVGDHKFLDVLDLHQNCSQCLIIGRCNNLESPEAGLTLRSLLFGTSVHSHKTLIVTASRRRSDHMGRVDPWRPGEPGPGTRQQRLGNFRGYCQTYPIHWA